MCLGYCFDVHLYIFMLNRFNVQYRSSNSFVACLDSVKNFYALQYGFIAWLLSTSVGLLLSFLRYVLIYSIFCFLSLFFFRLDKELAWSVFLFSFTICKLNANFTRNLFIVLVLGGGYPEKVSPVFCLNIVNLVFLVSCACG